MTALSLRCQISRRSPKPWISNKGRRAPIALARAGSRLFWKTLDRDERAVRAGAAELAPVYALLAASVGLAVLAGPMHRYTRAAAEQLLAPQVYVERVLGTVPVTRGGGIGR